MGFFIFIHISSNRFNSAISEYARNSHIALSSKNQKSVLVLQNGTAPLVTAQKKTTKVIGVNLKSVWTFFYLFKILIKYKPKQVITYGGSENFQALILKLFFWNVNFYRFKGDKINSPSFWSILKLKLPHLHIKSYIVPSAFLKEQLMQQTKKPIRIIEMALDKEKFHFINSDIKNEIIIVGRLDPVKGLRKALSDFSEIQKKIPSLKLRIIGEPKNISKQTLEDWILVSGLMVGRDVYVDYTRVDKIENYMNEALFGWVCSEGSEYICRVAYEFLMCGTPMLVSRVHSLQSIFDSQDGFIYSHNSRNRVSEMAKFLQSQIKLRTSTREKRATKFQAIYSYESHVRKLLTI